MQTTTGTILTHSFGYSMTLVDFYEVVKETAKTVTVVKIGSKVVEGSNYGSGKVVPDPTRKSYREFRLMKPKANSTAYRGSMDCGYMQYLREWNGEAVFFNRMD